MSAAPPSPAVDLQAATLFQNPRSSETVDISSAGAYAFFFGFFYFAIRGVWSHAVAGAVLAFITFGISWLVYAYFAERIVRRHLLDTGWVPKAVAESAKVDRRGDRWIVGLLAGAIVLVVVVAITQH